MIVSESAHNISATIFRVVDKLFPLDEQQFSPSKIKAESLRRLVIDILEKKSTEMLTKNLQEMKNMLRFNAT
jgi:hypothetical protein